MVDRGFRVIFETSDGVDVSRAEHDALNLEVKFMRRGKIFELGWECGDDTLLCPVDGGNVAVGDDAAVRGRASAADPSPQEVLDHEATHEPYRQWCASCVAGRWVADPHLQAASCGAVPVIGMVFAWRQRGGWLNSRACGQGLRDEVDVRVAPAIQDN